MFGVPAKVKLKCRGDREFYKLFSWNGYVVLTEGMDTKPFVIEERLLK